MHTQKNVFISNIDNFVKHKYELQRFSQSIEGNRTNRLHAFEELKKPRHSIEW